MSGHISTNMVGQAQGSLTYMVLFESPTKNVHASYFFFSDNDSPEKWAVDIASAYKQHVNRFKRILYRGILLKKPTVSIVKMTGVTDVSLISGHGHQFLIQNKVHDPTLSFAIRKPAVLRGVERDAFCREYNNVFFDPDDLAPQSALLIHHINDPTASRVLGVAGSVFSITLGLVGALVL
ncbi:uncharacterized protein B0J16DRAFT_379671 [Fusarium flagelliforme]|uniref:uncharacterized protein n=1 Tax=Fusarium flagelliforme TaxID=2675880 RepID=UPI001E8EDB10|nr:uncharacterized protein B0J16DRAFT_379671 [Fusarium flagelliforme]KAH7191782.1 hypothetical protein B0J16DRAFT_379671 [Fusarium flagelliforme]